MCGGTAPDVKSRCRNELICLRGSIHFQGVVGDIGNALFIVIIGMSTGRPKSDMLSPKDSQKTH